MQAKSEQAELDKKLTEAVASLAKNVEGAIAAGNAFRADAQTVLPQLAHAVARKVAGQALDINPLPLIESVIQACLERILGEPHIVITVNDKLSGELEKRLSAQFSASNDPGEISIEGNAEMAASDCRIEWDNGKAERNTEEMWKEVAGVINDMVSANTSREIAAPKADEPVATPPPAASPESTQTPTEGA
jgi:flagellar assembly protein FliH